MISLIWNIFLAVLGGDYDLDVEEKDCKISDLQGE